MPQTKIFTDVQPLVNFAYYVKTRFGLIGSRHLLMTMAQFTKLCVP